MVILHFRVQRNDQVIQMELYDNYDIYIYICTERCMQIETDYFLILIERKC